MKKRLAILLATVIAVSTLACGKEVGEVAEPTVLVDASTTSVEETVEEVHEHAYEAVSNGDGTHSLVCECGDIKETVECVFDEEYVCTECGYKHEHTLEVVADVSATETYQHIYNCTEDEYSYTEDCALNEETYTCDICGQDMSYRIIYNEEAKTYYAKTDVNIRNLPTMDGSEVVRKAKTNDELTVVGYVESYKGVEEKFDVLDDGNFLKSGFLSETKVEVKPKEEKATTPKSSSSGVHAPLTTELYYKNGKEFTSAGTEAKATIAETLASYVGVSADFFDDLSGAVKTNYDFGVYYLKNGIGFGYNDWGGKQYSYVMRPANGGPSEMLCVMNVRVFY